LKPANDATRTRWSTTRARSLTGYPSEQLSDGVHVHLHLHSVAQAAKQLCSSRLSVPALLHVGGLLRSTVRWLGDRLSQRPWRQAVRCIVCCRSSMCNAAELVSQQQGIKQMCFPVRPWASEAFELKLQQDGVGAITAKRSQKGRLGPQQTFPPLGTPFILL
jgi:hypothetical protein